MCVVHAMIERLMST